MIYYDKWGLLTTKDGDGGDTLCRESFARFANHCMGKDLFGLQCSDEDFIKHCRVAPGLWRRHPDESKWYSNPFTTTRHQYTTLIYWLLLTGRWELVSEIIVRLRANYWFFPNTENGWGEGKKIWWKGQFPDFMSPDLYSILVHNRRKWVWPADQAILFGSQVMAGKVPGFDLGKGFYWGDNKQTGDDMNHIATLIVARHLNDTPTARLAQEIYQNEALWPPQIGLGFKDGISEDIQWDENRIMARLKYWFRDEMGSNPGFAEAMRPLVEKYFA